MAKVLFISDLGQSGSGYQNISSNLAVGMTRMGHEVRCIGLGYHGEEQYYPFSIYPCGGIDESKAEYHNLLQMWKQDITVGALDIPVLGRIMQQVLAEKDQPPFIGIFPVEGDPLCMDWALILAAMQGQFCISQFGTEECRKQGIQAEHLQIGIDTVSWRLPTPEEKKAVRISMGFTDEDLVILTVADNQERKNLLSALQIVHDLEERLGTPVKYVMVTREMQPTGYRLRTFAQEIGYTGLTIIERGLSFKQLLMTYFCADLFLLTSKAEGLCLPVIEAQATGLPVFATDCTALHELLNDGKGILLPVEFVNRDVFGNSNRYFVDEEKATSILQVFTSVFTEEEKQEVVSAGRHAVEQRSWDITNKQLDDKIKEILANEQAQSSVTPAIQNEIPAAVHAEGDA